MRYFFYGTLLDADVRRHILGDWIDRRALEPAWLGGFRRVYLRGRSYPVVIPDRREAVEGLLAQGLDRRAQINLDRFESDEYIAAIRPVRLEDGRNLPARVFLASALAFPTDRPWSITDWQRDHKRAFARRHRAPLGMN